MLPGALQLSYPPTSQHITLPFNLSILLSTMDHLCRASSPANTAIQSIPRPVTSFTLRLTVWNSDIGIEAHLTATKCVRSLKLAALQPERPALDT